MSDLPTQKGYGNIQNKFNCKDYRHTKLKKWNLNNTRTNESRGNANVVFVMRQLTMVSMCF